MTAVFLSKQKAAISSASYSAPSKRVAPTFSCGQTWPQSFKMLSHHVSSLYQASRLKIALSSYSERLTQRFSPCSKQLTRFPPKNLSPRQKKTSSPTSPTSPKSSDQISFPLSTISAPPPQPLPQHPLHFHTLDSQRSCWSGLLLSSRSWESTQPSTSKT